MERVLDLTFQGARQLVARHVVSGQEDVRQLAAALGLDGLDLLELRLRDEARLNEKRLERIARVPPAVARRDHAAPLEEDHRDVRACRELEHTRLLLDGDQLQDLREAEVVETTLESH